MSARTCPVEVRLDKDELVERYCYLPAGHEGDCRMSTWQQYIKGLI